MNNNSHGLNNVVPKVEYPIPKSDMIPNAMAEHDVLTFQGQDWVTTKSSIGMGII